MDQLVYASLNFIMSDLTFALSTLLFTENVFNHVLMYRCVIIPMYLDTK